MPNIAATSATSNPIDRSTVTCSVFCSRSLTKSIPSSLAIFSSAGTDAGCLAGFRFEGGTPFPSLLLILRHPEQLRNRGGTCAQHVGDVLPFETQTLEKSGLLR